LAAEQRRQHRIGVSLEVRIKGQNASGAMLSETTFSNDVSRGGCSFPSFYDYPVGSELEIEIYRRSAGAFGQAPFLTRGEVMRQFEADDGTRMIGVRFVGPQFPTYSSEGV
jgi:c-di-GMP-binding flagellar brake protein YcgR